MIEITFARGRFVTGRVVAGNWLHGMWSGEQRKPRRRSVLISTRRWWKATALAQLFQYEVPGIAPLLFMGESDRSREVVPLLGVIEARPEGAHLVDAGRLDPREVVRLGLGLCDTILACGPGGKPINGIRPETVFVAGDPGHRMYSGATPRAFMFLGMDGHGAAFPYAFYEAPEAPLSLETDPRSLVYSAAMVMWFALLGQHAFGDRNQDHRMGNDLREPFTGPPELGRLLEAVLVRDEARRLAVDELRSQLAALARAWGAELPPFPPPGLAQP